MLIASSLNFAYKDKAILKNINFTAPRGQLTCVIGPNGSGKTTLLKILSGALPVKSGSIMLDKKNFLDKSHFILPKWRSFLGLVFQHPSLDDKLSVLENLVYAQKIYTTSNNDNIDLVLEQSRLTNKRHEPIKKLSLGTRRRLELYRIFMHKPTLLLLDEPTSGLDVEEIERFYIFLKAYINQTNAIAIFSTHHEKEAKDCDHLISIKDGQTEYL
jgi:ABC-2 type transport system ATP-binding protein